MRPVPMAPTLTRLLGDAAPKTEAGTMAGKPATTEEATTPLPAVARNRRRSIFFIVMLGSVAKGWPSARPSEDESTSDPHAARRMARREDGGPIAAVLLSWGPLGRGPQTPRGSPR